eukprot:gene9534-33629_t
MAWQVDLPGVIEVSSSATTFTLTFRAEEYDRLGSNDKIFANQQITIDTNELNPDISKAYTFSITSGAAKGTEFGMYAKLYTPCVVEMEGTCFDQSKFYCTVPFFTDTSTCIGQSDLMPCCPATSSNVPVNTKSAIGSNGTSSSNITTSNRSTGQTNNAANPDLDHLSSSSSSDGIGAGFVALIVILVLLLLLVVSIYACAHCKAQTEREIPTSRAVMNAAYNEGQRNGAAAGTGEYAGFPMEDGNNVYNLGPRTPHRRNTTTLYAIPVEDDSVATSAGSAASGRARAATSTGIVVYVSTPNQNDPTPVYDVTGGATTSSSASTMPSAHEAEYAGLSGGGSPAKVGNTGQPLYRPVYDLTGGTTTTGTSASQPSAHEAAYAGFNGDGGGNECAYYDADPVTETSPYATPVDVDSSGNSGGSSA